MECDRIRNLDGIAAEHHAPRSGRHFGGSQLQGHQLRRQLGRTQAQNWHGATFNDRTKIARVKGLNQIRTQFGDDPRTPVHLLMELIRWKSLAGQRKVFAHYGHAKFLGRTTQVSEHLHVVRIIRFAPCLEGQRNQRHVRAQPQSFSRRKCRYGCTLPEIQRGTVRCTPIQAHHSQRCTFVIKSLPAVMEHAGREQYPIHAGRHPTRGFGQISHSFQWSFEETMIHRHDHCPFVSVEESLITNVFHC